ncbi:hypothetical protein C2G38_2077725 [Gigaspora rosea]|uniref:Uncharacterized protein n=1 Tax=Gigaspora rosea TaxID=44941 RepID=A0A397VGM7_9GLOM|nr:hypothetical protein C2G38_2077725 [Gigaspora rosea]
MHKFTEALEDLSKSLEIGPNNAATLTCRGILLYEMISTEYLYTDLLADACTSREFGINDRGKINVQGQSLPHYHICKYEVALRDLTKSLEINSNNKTALFFRGNLYHKIYKYKEAIEDLSKLLDIEPSESNAFELRG